MQYSLSEIHNALNSALAGVSSLANVKTIETYQNQFSEAEVKAEIYKFPSLYTVHISTSFETVNRRVSKTHKFFIFAGDTGYKSQEQALTGSNATHPGTYALCDAVEKTLQSYGPLLNGLGPATVNDISSLYNTGGMSIYAITVIIKEDE